MMSENKLNKDSKREFDVFKDTWIRYLGGVVLVATVFTKRTYLSKNLNLILSGGLTSNGYANEVGEAFRVIIPVSVVRASYVVASLYVLADSVDKGRQAWLKTGENASRYKNTGIAFGDTLAWQGLASVIVPGFTINRICWLARTTLKKLPNLPGPIQRWAVVSIGLGAIPFIIKPIDESVHYVMDRTVRKSYSD